MSDDEDTGDASDEARKRAALLADLERLAGAACRGCGVPTCGHDGVVAVLMGWKTVPRCARCAAEVLERDLPAFRADVLAHVAHRDCFSAGWAWANDSERGVGAAGCRWPRVPASSSDAPLPLPENASAPAADASWDAGDMSCGDLVLELRQRLGRMTPGQLLLLTARDPGAPEDIPAWCGLTGHRLVAAQPPTYLIRRKEP